MYNIISKFLSYERTKTKILQKDEKEMFKNIGSKIKNVAQFFTWVGIIISIVVFLMLISKGSDESIGMGFIILIIGCFGSWLSSLVLYGFGQLVENSDIIAQKSSRPHLTLTEVNKDSYKKDPYYQVSDKDERTFEQVVDDSNLTYEQKNKIKELKDWLNDDIIDVTNFCQRLRQVASNQPTELINKLISKL